MRATLALVSVVLTTLVAAPTAVATPSLLTDTIGPFGQPYGIAVSPDGSSVRVLEVIDDAVQYVDPVTNTISGAEVGVGNDPYFGAFDASGSTFFAANWNSGTVSVIVGRAVVSTIAVGNKPYLIKPVAAGAKLVTLNQGAAGAPGVSLIDAATRTVDRTVSTGTAGNQVTSLAVHPAGTTAWVTSIADLYLKKVTLATGAVTTITPSLVGGQVPRAVFASPSGATLALITRGTNELILLDGSTGTIAHRISLGTQRAWAVAFSPDGATAYALVDDTGGINPQVRAYTVATGALSRSFPLSTDDTLPGDGDPAEWFTTTPDGVNLVVATIDASGDTAVNLIDTRSGRRDAVALPNFIGRFGYLALNPAGTRIYVSNGRSTGLLAALAAVSTPGAPTAVAARAGNGSALVSWTAPSDDGGAIVSRYTATAAPGGQTCAWTTGDLACTLTGLTNGTGYNVSVTATTVAGTSVASSAVAVTPADAPGRPTAVTAVAGLLRAVVSWKAPTDTGGGITGYTATASPGGGTCTTTGALTCTITGLLNTTAYTITVVARSAGGTGTASSASTAVRPYKQLAMRKPSASATRIRSSVPATGPSTITQLTTSASGATICRATAAPKTKGTSTLTCTVNKATRTALKKKAATVTVLTTLRTKQGASFGATHRVTLPKSG
ncbi:MAG: fibronectin type III domain-containing protein [Actinobacteria bacterium]|nr:fibronectin type III domain-containing protein [Actinomycetota bacterium]